MKRLVFIVEGNTEIILVNKLIAPYLIEQGFSISIHAQTIVTSRKQFKKGGIGSYGKFRNEISRTLAQGNVIVTTLIDFFKLPTDFRPLNGGLIFKSDKYFNLSFSASLLFY